MANNPETYDNRVLYKTALSALAECKRAALRMLPVDFFVHYFVRILKEIKYNNNFRDVLAQFLQYYWDSSQNKQATQDAVDILIELFEAELDTQNISNKEIISKTYREYLMNYRWAIREIAWVNDTIKQYEVQKENSQS